MSDITPIPDVNHAEFSTIAKEIGDLVTEKNQAYGDSVGKLNRILPILYPNGVKPEQYPDLLLVIRVLDKINRISQGNAHSLGEDSYADIAGYGILAVAAHRKHECK